MHLGDSQHATAEPDDARVAWRHALDVLDRLGHPDAAQVRSRLDDEPAAR